MKKQFSNLIIVFLHYSRSYPSLKGRWGGLKLLLLDMDPLSIIASITGIIMAAGKVSNLLSQIKNAPTSVANILAEVDHIKIVFTALNNFINRNGRIRGARAALIQLDDIVIILTQTVLVFSELETIVTPLSSKGKLSGWRRLNWSRQEAAAVRLVNQLQRHKTSLSLLLQIIIW